jgi:hypothetical protein
VCTHVYTSLEFIFPQLRDERIDFCTKSKTEKPGGHNSAQAQGNERSMRTYTNNKRRWARNQFANQIRDLNFKFNFGLLWAPESSSS